MAVKFIEKLEHINELFTMISQDQDYSLNVRVAAIEALTANTKLILELYKNPFSENDK